MPRTSYVLRNPACIEHRDLPAGTVIATIETPDGVPTLNALQAVVRGLAIPQDPTPPQAAAAHDDAAAPTPAAELPHAVEPAAVAATTPTEPPHEAAVEHDGH